MLKLQLVRDGEVILEVPLSPSDWPKQRLEDELNSMEKKFYRFSRIFDALSNETRLRMMKKLMGEETYTMNFSQFMNELELNPKLVWENARRLREEGLLNKTGRGQYRCSEFGQRTFIMMNVALSHLMEMLEDFDEL